MQTVSPHGTQIHVDIEIDDCCQNANAHLNCILDVVYWVDCFVLNDFIKHDDWKYSEDEQSWEYDSIEIVRTTTLKRKRRDRQNHPQHFYFPNIGLLEKPRSYLDRLIVANVRSYDNSLKSVFVKLHTPSGCKEPFPSFLPLTLGKSDEHCDEWNPYPCRWCA